MVNSEQVWIWKTILPNWHNLVTLDYQKILILKKIVRWVLLVLAQARPILQVWAQALVQVLVLRIAKIKIKKEPQIKNLNLKKVKNYQKISKVKLSLSKSWF